MRKTVYIERIKRITDTIGEEIEALSKEFLMTNSPEARELRDAYSRFSEKVNKLAPVYYLTNKNIEPGIYDLIAETREYVTEERAKILKQLNRHKKQKH